MTPERNVRHSLSGLAVIALGMLLVADSAFAVTLSEGRRAIFTNRDNPKQDKVRLVFRDDPGLLSLTSPLCPTTSEIRVITSNGDEVTVPLDCNRWEAKKSIHRYRGNRPDDPAGVRSIRYGVGKLSVLVKGGGYAVDAISGPADWVETTFIVAGIEHCGRWSSFKKNQGDKIVAQAPTTACEISCGDGDLDAPYEECDDGNLDDGDGCSASCDVEVCGDGVHSPPFEACDDGNAIDGDGCDSNCTVTACGNGIVSAGEQCDDGNALSGDGCRDDCSLEACGDGILDAAEQCDDGNSDDGDCCSSLCEFESGVCSDASNCTENDVCQAGVCVGDPIQPWFNEIDYDNNSGGIVDREEFIEIAGPAGLDLGGYTVYGVEGADGSCQTPGSGLLSGPVLPGYVHWSVTIPAGTVLADDTGTGVGFLVICNSPSSQTVINAGNCDIVFPGIASDSNFRNGELLNNPVVCPDGVLMLDPDSNLADSISYEGIVPNAGPLGSYFHIDPAFNIGADEGWKPQTSLEKWTDNLGKATSASEWRDSGGCTNQCVAGGLNFDCNWFTGLDPCLGFDATPGALNGGTQRYFCSELFCGDGVVTGDEQCDEGASNSDAPDATCRTDCTVRRCGDGIIDPSVPGFPETCEADTDCGSGEVCSACGCTTGTPLGDVDLSIVPGSAANEPVDDGQSTWLRINQPLPALLPITTGSNGQWTPGPITFTAGAPDLDGLAPFYLAQEVLLSAPLPALAGGGRVCLKVRPDYDTVGTLDCDGGTNVDVAIAVNSNGAGAPSAASLTVGANPGDSGAGAAVAYVYVQGGTTGDNVTPCEDAVYDAPIRTAVTTGTASSQIVNGLTVGNVSVSLSGQPFDCSNWTPDSGASVAGPTYNMDVSVPVLGVQDVSQVLRLNDD